MFVSQPSQTPIMVKLIEPRKDPTGLADVLLGALGLAGALTLLAVLFGAVLAGVMYWIRSRSA